MINAKQRALFPFVSCEPSEVADPESHDISRRISRLRCDAQTYRASAVVVAGLEGIVGLEGRRNLLDFAQLNDLMADEAESRLRSR